MTPIRFQGEIAPADAKSRMKQRLAAWARRALLLLAFLLLACAGIGAYLRYFPPGESPLATALPFWEAALAPLRGSFLGFLVFAVVAFAGWVQQSGDDEVEEIHAEPLPISGSADADHLELEYTQGPSGNHTWDQVTQVKMRADRLLLGFGWKKYFEHYKSGPSLIREEAEFFVPFNRSLFQCDADWQSFRSLVQALAHPTKKPYRRWDQIDIG